MTRIGDRPAYPLSNQRFDKGDARQIAQMYESLITRFMGALVGQAWGCASTPLFDMEYPVGPPPEVRVRVGQCLLMQSVGEDGVNNNDFNKGPFVAKVLLHDPDKGVQTSSSIDVTAYAPTALGGGGGTGGQRCWLVFRRQEAPSALDNKVRWDTTSDTETVAAGNLETQEWVEFAAVATIANANATYGEANGWFRFAYISTWSETGPTIVPIHWVHGTYFRDAAPPNFTGTQSALALNQNTSWDGGGNAGFSPETGMPGIGQLLHWLMLKVGQHVNPGNVFEFGRPSGVGNNLSLGATVQLGLTPDGWLSVPTRGLVQHNAEIDGLTSALASGLAATNARIDGIEAGFLPRVLQVVYYTQSTGIYTNMVGDTEAGLTVSGAFVLNTHILTLTGAGAHSLYAVQCIPRRSASFTGADVPRSGVVRETTTLPTQFSLVPTFDVEARLIVPAGTPVDENCMFILVGRRT